MGALCLRMTAKSRISRSSSSIVNPPVVTMGCDRSSLKPSSEATERPSRPARMLLCQLLPQDLVCQSPSQGANTFACNTLISAHSLVEDLQFFRTSKDALKEAAPHPGFSATSGQYNFAWPCDWRHGCGRPTLASWTLSLALAAY